MRERRRRGWLRRQPAVPQPSPASETRRPRGARTEGQKVVLLLALVAGSSTDPDPSRLWPAGPAPPGAVVGSGASSVGPCCAVVRCRHDATLSRDQRLHQTWGDSPHPHRPDPPAKRSMDQLAAVVTRETGQRTATKVQRQAQAIETTKRPRRRPLPTVVHATTRPSSATSRRLSSSA
jgi:hypothetical protein